MEFNSYVKLSLNEYKELYEKAKAWDEQCLKEGLDGINKRIKEGIIDTEVNLWT